MPYLNCSSCETSIYRARAFSTVEECPRCLMRSRRPVPMFVTARRYEPRFGLRKTETTPSHGAEAGAREPLGRVRPGP